MDVWWAENDWASSRKDVAHILDQLPRVSGVHRIDVPHFGHLDFLWSLEGREGSQSCQMRSGGGKNT